MAVDDFFAQLNPATLLNLSPVTPTGSSAAGAGLPVTTTTSADHGAKPWHPDSPLFWLAVVAGASLAGIVGASVNLHAGPAKARASVGK